MLTHQSVSRSIVSRVFLMSVMFVVMFVMTGCLGKVEIAQDARYGSTKSSLIPVSSNLPAAAPTGAPVPTASPVAPGSLGAQSVPIFEATLFPLVVTNCTRCHGVNQAPIFAINQAQSSHDAVLSFGLVDLVTPTNSRLVQKINTGHQGFGASLASLFAAQIQSWSDQLKQVGAMVPTAPVLEAKFSSINALILQPKCVSCHGATLARDGIRYDTYNATLRTVNLNTPSNSKFYTSVNDGSMPPRPAPDLTTQEVMIILEWIKLGAPNN